MTGDLAFRVAADAASREAVYLFRERVASEQPGAIDLLAGPYRAAGGPGLQDLLDPLAIVVAAVDVHSSSIVGCARTNHMRDGVVPVYPELYGLGELASNAFTSSSITTCWTLAPPLDCSVGHDVHHPSTQLAWLLYEIALRERVCHDFLDCADDDMPFFLGLGYRWQRRITHPTRGASNLMKLDIYDWSYLAAVDSPFLQLARGVA